MPRETLSPHLFLRLSTKKMKLASKFIDWWKETKTFYLEDIYIDGLWKMTFLWRKSEVYQNLRTKCLKTYIKHPSSHPVAGHSNTPLYVLLVLSQCNVLNVQRVLLLLRSYYLVNIWYFIRNNTPSIVHILLYKVTNNNQTKVRSLWDKVKQ